MRHILFAVGLRLCAAAAPSICGSDPDKVEDCNHPDLGSCGNACCYASAEFSEDSAALYARVVQGLKSGVDTTYAYVSEGSPPDPEEDLQQYNITDPLAFQFIFQGAHSAPKFFGANADVLDFSIVKTAKGSALYMFSLSRIHGALGDYGQNYKTLAYLAKALNPAAQLSVIHGCGGPVTTLREVNLEIGSGIGDGSSCGADPSKVKDCDHPDLGSCGNACCLLEFDFQASPEDVYASVTDALKNKVDGAYDYITGGDPNPGDDLRQYNITQPAAFQYIFQGDHNAPKFFGQHADILDFSIAKASSGSTLRMFSLSRIHGALGDHSQNYKNLVFLSKNFSIASKAPARILHGCGLASASKEVMI